MNRKQMLEERLAYYQTRLTIVNKAIDAYVEKHGVDDEAKEHLRAVQRDCSNDVAAIQNELIEIRKVR